ncbi:MAG: FAD-dependent oxidoreductase [Nitrospira sp.]
MCACIGAGMAGLSTAYCLVREGRSVVVLDDGPIGGGMTERTTAHLANAIDDGYVEIERLHGPEGAKLAAASHMAAIDRIETIIAEERIDCDFERLDGYLFVTPDQSREALQAEWSAARRAGVNGIEQLNHSPIPTLSSSPCLRFPRQAQFHPLKFMQGLVRGIERLGGRIFTDTHAESMIGGKQARVNTSSGQAVAAQAIVVATNSPVNDMVAVHTKQAPYMSYVIGATIPSEALKKALYWDMADPYHYVRIVRDQSHDVIVIGGEDHKTGQVDDGEQRYERLEQWARKWFPFMQKISYRWSGQVMESVDGLGFIGRNPHDESNVYIATGDSGMGMTHGMIAGMLNTDLILGRQNTWTSLYDPSRRRLNAVGTFTSENVNVAAQYTDWISSGDVASEEHIAKGTGAVIRKGLHKLAVYRDEEGELYRCSAVCPHLKCIVGWNSDDNTWDCPCHGSRFDRFGKVLNGPANSNLVPAEDV